MQQRVIFLFPVALVLVFLSVRLVSAEAYTSLLREDGAVEYAQSIAYLFSFVLALIIAGGLFRGGRTAIGVLYSILAFGFLFIAGEEISWGQRLFDVATPDYFHQRNTQAELNLHNLSLLESLFDHMYMLIGLYGGLMSTLLPRRLMRDRGATVHLFVPDRILALYFLPAAAFYLYWHYLKETVDQHLGRKFIVAHNQELAELLLALGFVLFTAANSSWAAGKRRSAGTVEST